MPIKRIKILIEKSTPLYIHVPRYQYVGLYPFILRSVSAQGIRDIRFRYLDPLTSFYDIGRDHWLFLSFLFFSYFFFFCSFQKIYKLLWEMVEKIRGHSESTKRLERTGEAGRGEERRWNIFPLCSGGWLPLPTACVSRDHMWQEMSWVIPEWYLIWLKLSSGSSYDLIDGIPFTS